MKKQLKKIFGHPHNQHNISKSQHTPNFPKNDNNNSQPERVVKKKQFIKYQIC